MPIVEVKDRGVEVEFPDSMTAEDIQKVLKEQFPPGKKSTATEAGVGGFVRGVGPTAAFVGAAGLGAKWGAGAGLAVAGGPEDPLAAVTVPAGAFIGAMAAGIPAAWAAHKAQSKLADVVAPESVFGSEAEATQSQEHPIASGVGEVLSGLPVLKVTPPGGILRRPFQKAIIPAALGASIGTVQPLLQGQSPTLGGIAEQTAMSILYREPRFGKGAANARSQPSTESQAQREVRPSVGQETSLRQQGETAPAQEAPKPVLSPEHEALVQTEAKEQGVKLRPAQLPKRVVSSINRATGEVLIDPEQLSQEIGNVPEKQRQQYIRSLLNEEKIHLSVTPEQADAYWLTLTAPEKAIATRIYTGKWGRPAELTQTQVAHDALRFRLQQLARMTPREIAEAARRERWTVQSLDLVGRSIQGGREMMNAAASREGLAIIRAIDNNLGVAKAAVAAPTDDEAYAAAERAGMSEEAAPAAVAGENEPFAVMKPQAVTIEKADGTRYEAEFNGYYDLSKMGRGMVPSIGRTLDNGQVSHGLLSKGERVITKIPEPEPASFSKGKKKGEPTKEFFLPPVPQGTQAERNVTLERGSQAGPIRQTITPAKIEEDAVRHLTERARPSFAAFAEELRRGMPELKPDQLRSAWQDAVWKRLESASGSEIESLRTQLGLGREIGGSIPDVPEAMTPEQEAAREKVRRQRPPGEPDQPYRMPFQAEQSRRAEAIATIGQKLIAESEQGRKAWRRADVTPEEVATYKGEGAYREITPLEVKNPDTLGKLLTEGGAVERTTSTRKVRGGKLVEVKRKAPPESVTRRLTALVNKSTGKVYLVSTYRHGRLGAMLVDPAATSIERPNVPLKSLLARGYQPVASMLLDEPVQNFKQKFDSVADWQAKFAGEVTKAQAAEASYEAPGEGAFTKSPTGALIATPGVSQEGRGAISQGGRMTDAEASSIMDQMTGEVGAIGSVEDVKLAIEGLKEETNAQALSAWRKLAQAIDEANPDLTQEQLIEKLATTIYENHVNAKDFEDFQRRTLAIANAKAGEAPEIPAAPAPETGRELTALARRSPAVGVPRIPPQPAPAAPSPFLDPQAQAQMRASLESRYSSQAEAQTPAAAVDQVWKELSGTSPGRVVEYQGGVTKFYPKGIGKLGTVEAPGEAPPELAERQMDLLLQKSTDQGGEPAAWAKFVQGARDTAEDARMEFEKARGQIGAMVSQKDVRDTITRKLDAADNAANNLGEEVQKSILAASLSPADLARADALSKSANPANKARGFLLRKEGNRQVLAAANAVVQAGFDATRLPEFFQEVDLGIQRATAKTQSRNWKERREGKQQLLWAQQLRSELEYARAHWTDSELMATARAAKEALDRNIVTATNAGLSVNWLDDYLPGRYDAEFFNGNSVVFGPMRIIGRKWRAPKTFKSYYHAIAAGPYLPVTRDIAALVGHSTRQMAREINRGQWWQNLKNYMDPDSGKAVAVDAMPVPGAPGTWKAPSPEYSLFYPKKGGKPIAVLGSEHSSYGQLVRSLTAPSAVSEFVPAAIALEWGQKLKHTLLMGDFFHLGRLTYYGGAIMGRKWGYRGGITALEYGNPKDLAQAVRIGVVSAKDAAWAQAPVQITVNGRTVTATRMGLKKMFVAQGLNVGRIQDALYKDMVANLPVIGGAAHAYNRWLFDRFTRGLMMQSAIHEFERISAKNPGMDANQIIKTVSRDTNNFYGSIGRQGWFKSATFQDLTRLVGLAPQWVEGLVKKEISPLRLATRMKEVLRGQETTARGIGRGLVAMVLITQAINLITKKKPTWQNEEPDHKLDAWIPDSSGQGGVFLSPMAVFNELTWELVDGMEKKPKAWDAVTQIGRNKLGLWGRAANVLWTSRSGMQREITSTGGVFTEAAKQLAPVPISFGRFAQEAGSHIAPGLISKPAPGATQRQMMGVLGLKTSVAQGPAGQMQTLASRFLQANNLKPETGWQLVQTDEPSYSKLRGAIRNNDSRGATVILAGLRRSGKTDDQIVKAMTLYTRRPFTNSSQHEEQFFYSLDDRGRELYSEAVMQRQAELNQFLDWYSQQPQRQ